MHDTNQRNCSSDDYRFVSHGCLAGRQCARSRTWLLQAEDSEMNRAALDAAIATGQRQDIALPNKVPVAWIYLTAWMTRDQTIQFPQRHLRQDEQLLEATAEEAALLQPGEQPSADGASGAVNPQ